MSYNVLNVTRGILLGREMYKALGALEIAAKAHEGQTRKGSGEDYINHPLAVATELLSSGVYDEDVISAAFLHDVLEDTMITPTDLLEKGVTPQTLRIVQLLTKPKAIEGESDEEFNGRYYSAIMRDYRAELVKCADRVHNLSTMGECWGPDKIKSYIAEAESYVMPMLKELRWEHPEYASACFNMKLVIDAIANLSLTLK